MKRRKYPRKTNNDFLREIRKPVAKPGCAFKDKSKYSRKDKDHEKE